jgi:hypothetical protein
LASEAVAPGGKCRGLRRRQHQLTVARTTGDPAMKVLPNDGLGVTSKCRYRSTFSSHSPPLSRLCICNSGTWTSVRHDLSTVLRWRRFDGAHEKRGSHDGLYAARMYRHDRRRLLRRLRQSRGRRPVRSGSDRGFRGVARSCRRARPDGGPAGAGSSPEAEERGSHHGLHPARVYQHDRRQLLRGLRESRGRRPVRCRSSFERVARSCRRAWPSGSPAVDTPSCLC